jgi:predicted RNase H-like HicB family nuclease
MHTVVLVYHQEPEGWWVDSPDPGLEGFVAGGDSLDEARRLAWDGLRFYLDESDLEIEERFDPLAEVRVESQSLVLTTVSATFGVAAAAHVEPAGGHSRHLELRAAG